MIPIGCKECGYGAEVAADQMPVLCPHCGRPGLALDAIPPVDDQMQKQFDQAMQAALERWRAKHSDHGV